jgi:hypothetical protein
MAVERCPTCKQAIPSKKRPGRPPKLTRQLIAEFEAHLQNGNFPEVVARAMGIAPSTYYRWKSEGEHPDATGRVKEFSEALQRARARGTLNYVTKLAAAANENDVQAIKFYLERTDPENWGRKDTLRVEQLVSREDLYLLMQELGDSTRHAIEDGFALGESATTILQRIQDAWREIWRNRVQAARTRADDAWSAGALPNGNGDEHGDASPE